MRNLAIGQSGEVTVTAPCKNAAGRWVAAPRPQKATRWKARVYIPGEDGLHQEIVRFARTRREVEAAIEAAIETALVSPDAPNKVDDLPRGRPGVTYVKSQTSSLGGLSLYQANDPQRLRGVLQRVAQAHGSASAKKAKSVISGVIAYAVDRGVLTSNAMRQVRTVTSTKSQTFQRDHTRAMTRAERDHVVQQSYDAAQLPGLNPRTRRKRTAAADLVAILAGTGVRIDEARRLRWDQVDLDIGRAYIRGTKSEVRTVGSTFHSGWWRSSLLVPSGTDRGAASFPLRRT